MTLFASPEFSFRNTLPTYDAAVTSYGSDAFRLSTPNGRDASSFTLCDTNRVYRTLSPDLSAFWPQLKVAPILERVRLALESQQKENPSGRPPPPSSLSELGLRLLRPYRPNLGNVLKAAREYADPEELLESLKAMELVPSNWLDEVRGFSKRWFSDESGNCWSNPPTLDLLIALASDPQGMMQAECLAYEAVSRLAPFLETIPKVVQWRPVDGRWRSNSRNRCFEAVSYYIRKVFFKQEEAFQERHLRTVKERTDEFLKLVRNPSEVLQKHPAFDLGFSWRHCREERVLTEPFNDSSDDPFEPLIGFNGLYSLGYTIGGIHYISRPRAHELCIVLGAPKAGL